MKRIAAAVVLVSVLAAPRDARADELEVDKSIHVPIILGGLTGYVLAEAVFKDALAPETCKWCGPILFDDAVRDAVLWPDKNVAHQLSNVTGFALTPLVAIGGVGLAASLDDRRGTFTDDALIIIEAAVLTADVNNLVKILIGRERPFVHALPGDQKPLTKHPNDNNLSFYSGHSAYSMSLAVAAGQVASMRGYRWAPALWATGVGLSLTTGYLRIAADKHWTTDVMTGWVTGAIVGYLVPHLHKKSGTGVVPAATGQTIGFSVAW